MNYKDIPTGTEVNRRTWNHWTEKTGRCERDMLDIKASIWADKSRTYSTDTWEEA